MERYFQERHATEATTNRGDIDDHVYDDITQNGLLPSTKVNHRNKLTRPLHSIKIFENLGPEFVDHQVSHG